ncbi:F-box/FBD/LRR protein [Rhynchospora pubera]|uniref:F-box/FBD/LRR protein n=1 Tax=Rhynchospora pubera TaxID=906938 RepID=A0AAV8D9I0_9POAL|nr:F-box/FBD/LRR protein [Rhynchospora pubera]
MDSKTHPKRVEANDDRITNLPDDLKSNILERLPLEEAVRTSFLSRKWRYTWASIPNLAFDVYFVKAPESTKFIDTVLLLHQGPIRKFYLSSKDLTVVPIERWILVLSIHGLEEINIRCYSMWRMPSCFFTIQSLKKVYLNDCILKLPHTFCGLKLLQFLSLDSCTISDDDFEKLVSSCPLLENLYLLFTSLRAVKINSPNLKLVKIDGFDKKYIHFITPGLIEASLSFLELSNDKIDYGNCLIDMFCSLSKIERLHLGCGVILYLKRGNNLKLPLKFDHLKELYMQLYVEDRNEATFAFSLLQNAPNLQYLRLAICPIGFDALVSIGTFWDLAMHNIVFEHLKFASIMYRGSVTESGLLPVRLLLLAAPLLEKMHIINYRKDFEFLKKLVSFKRASKEAEILLFDSVEDQYV